MKIVELIIDETDEFSGIDAISIVEHPAIEENFIALNKTKEYRFAEVDTEKKFPKYSKCKCDPISCLNYMSWLDVCEQNRGNILWLKDRMKENVL